MAKIVAISLYSVVLALCGVACHDSTGPNRRAITATGTLGAAFQPGSAEPGQQVELDVTLPQIAGTDNVHVVVSFSGVAQETDTVVSPTNQTELVGDFALPRATPPGSLFADVSVVEISQTAHATLQVVPISGPLLAPTVNQRGDPPMPEMPVGAVMLRAGSTVQLNLRARDDQRGLAFIGYAFGSPPIAVDTIRLNGRTVIDTSVSIDVPGALAGTRTPLTMFGRNTWGGNSSVSLGDNVFGYVARPTRSIGLGVTPLAAAEDMKRGVLYVSEPDSNRVATISLSAGTVQSYIRTPYNPADLDLTKSGDSLLIALSGSSYVGIVDLTASPVLVDTLRLQYQSSFDPPNTVPWVEHVRADALGRALVSLSYPDTYGIGNHDRLVLIEFATGTQRLLYGGPGVHDMPIAASGDRATMLMPYVDIDMRPLVYTSSATNVGYGSPLPVELWQYSGSVSADTHGRLFLLGSYLFNSGLGLLQKFGITNYASITTLLSPDGHELFAANQSFCMKYPASCDADSSYVLRWTTANQLTEVFKVPQWVRREYLLADGHTLVTLGISAVSLTDVSAGVGQRLTTGRGVQPVRSKTHPPAVAREWLLDEPFSGKLPSINYQFRVSGMCMARLGMKRTCEDVFGPQWLNVPVAPCCATSQLTAATECNAGPLLKVSTC
jgi:hypothetical protein